MKFRPAIGESDFRSIRDRGAGYVDKTNFISEVLDDMNPVLLFPRPRRFGKTLNMSTLGYFLRRSDEDLTHLFEGLAVSRDPQAMKHFQRYPTVSVTFKGDAATMQAQIRERQYAADVLASGASVVYEYAMVFDGKEAWVKRVEDILAPN
jgi:hypothetical protein